MKKHTFTNYVKEATMWLRPLGVDAPDMMFKIFEYRSFQDYVDAVDQWLNDLSDNYGELVEEAEPVSWDYIPDSAIYDATREGISADGWAIAKMICEKAEELNIDPDSLSEIVEEYVSDPDDFESWWDDNVIGRMTVKEYAEQLADEGAVDYEAYFDYEQFGRDLLAGGDISEIVEEIGTDAARKEVENLSDVEAADWYLDNQGLELSDLGQKTLKDYFDVEAFARDLELGGDVTQYGSNSNPILIRG